MDLQVFSPEQEDIGFISDAVYALDGSGVGFEDGEYTGLDDDQIDFGGDGTSFANELAAHRVFTVVVNNTSNLPERISLGAAMEPVAGTQQLVEGNVGGKGTLTCQGDPSSYNFFKKFIEKHPARLVAIKMTSSNEAQLAQAFMLTHVSPFENLGSKPLSLASYTKETQFNARMVTLKNMDFQLDDQTDLSIAIPPNTQTVFTLYIGGIHNAAKALDAKAKRAKRSQRVRASKV